MTGKELAEQMLFDNDVFDVGVSLATSVPYDKYVVGERTIFFSPKTNYGSEIRELAVSAHECGHAIQHRKGYLPLLLKAIFPKSKKLTLMVEQDATKRALYYLEKQLSPTDYEQAKQVLSAFLDTYR